MSAGKKDICMSRGSFLRCITRQVHQEMVAGVWVKAVIVAVNLATTSKWANSDEIQQQSPSTACVADAVLPFIAVQCCRELANVKKKCSSLRVSEMNYNRHHCCKVCFQAKSRPQFENRRVEICSVNFLRKHLAFQHQKNL